MIDDLINVSFNLTACFVTRMVCNKILGYHIAISVLSVVFTVSKKCGIMAMGLANFIQNSYDTVFRTYSENRYESSKYKEVARQESASVVFD